MDNDDPDDLFLKAMQNVKPLRMKVEKITIKNKKNISSSTNNSNRADDINDNIILDDLQPLPAELILNQNKANIHHKKYQRFRRGELRPQATLDLHNLSMIDALNLINKQLIRWQQQQLTVVLIIHGKGQGWLKALCQQWLQSSSAIMAYHSAIAQDGGTGAVYALLR